MSTWNHDAAIEPSGPAMFGPAHQRLAEEDAERMRWLDERCRLEESEEAVEFETVAPPRLCVCGCGRPVARRKSRVGQEPKYATPQCRYWARKKAGKR